MELPNTTVRCSVTGKHANGGSAYGLEIPVTYTLRGQDMKQNCLK